MKIISVVGARPNFMKIAPFIKEIHKFNNHNNDIIHHILVHTGQHYDLNMSDTFFKSLEIPEPDINLGVGSGTHAEQVGKTMIEFEKVLKIEKPDWVVVVGDVNATLACSITAKKEWVKCCHIEAGLRSGDLTMPEEINRIVTDRLSDLLLTPDKIAIENLNKEGVDKRKIVFVGNIMIDTLEENKNKASLLDPFEIIIRNYISGKKEIDDNYALVTIHRPSNVDNIDIFSSIVDFFIYEVSIHQQIIWPVHPRSYKNLKDFGLLSKVEKTPNITLLRPLDYHDMLRLNMSAKVVLTDSGGLQEECTVLGTPCLTLRWNTERPVTLREYGGASVLVGNNIINIRTEYLKTLKMTRKPMIPEYWDGKTAQRCLTAILNYKI